MILDYTAILKRAGLRVTKPRISALTVFAKKPHATAEEVRQGVIQHLGSVSTQAVYDVLHALTKTGIVREIEPAGSVSRYEILYQRNHHHLICRECYEIIDVACQIGEPPCLSLPDNHGFEIDEAEVNFWGLCPNCKEAQSTNN